MQNMRLKDIQLLVNIYNGRRLEVVFLPHVSAVYAVAWCLSVCHAVYCIHMAEDIVKLLSRSGSPIILVV